MALELYAPFINKSVQAGSGGVPVAVMVTGKVTGSGVDLDDQIVDFEWATKALQEWYARAGNIREMHQSKAIGKAVDLQRSDDGDGFDVTARITDPGAMQKVLDGVLQGFSIGIKRRPSDPPIVVRDKVAKGGRIQAGLISEISLVDAPAYPKALVSNVETLWKMAGGAEELVDDDEPLGDDLPDAAVDVTKAVDADSERKSPPKGYPQDKSEYADPSRFGFPIDTPARVRSAMAYFNAGKGKGQQGRTADDWASIGRKIAAAANEHFGPGHSLKGDQITHDDAETKKSLTETLSGVIPVLVDGEGAPVLGNVRWITKADGSQTAVAGDLSYDPFPTEERNGFAAPPDPTSDAAFTDTSQALAKDATPAMPNGQSVVPGPNDASHFQPVDNPPTPSVPAELTPTPANNLAGEGGGFSHQDADQLAKALSANVDALLATGDADIVKNGVARALGPTATSLLFQMLSNEVDEDGGTGSMACDIAAIACAYDKLICFIQSELAEEGEGPMLGKAADLTGKVYKALSENYPSRVLDWVKDASWSLNDAVPLADINMSRRPGGRDPEKVKGIAEAIEQGKKMDPVVLVKTSDGLDIADGYHRTLAFQHAGRKTIPAYVAENAGEHGPWEKAMHDAKLNKVAQNRDVIQSLSDMLRVLEPELATVQATKAVDGDAPADPETVSALQAEIARLTAENADLQKTLDATPVNDGPVKTLLTVPAQATVAQVDIDAALARFANEQEPRAKREALAQYLALTQTH